MTHSTPRTMRCRASASWSAAWRPSREAHGRDARRHRPLHRIPRLEDRSRDDAPRPCDGAARVVGPVARDHGGVGLADGVAVAATARRAGSARHAAAARPDLLRGLCGGTGAADVAGWRRVADLRDLAAA